VTPREVAVVADSACDLPPDNATGISVVPLTVSFGDESYLDGVELPPQRFWELVRTSSQHPTTASPPPGSFLEAYGRAAEEGAEGIVSIHVSARLSRTVESARAAAAEAPVPVEVVDTRSVSLGEGLVALEAIRAAAEEGADLGTVTRAAREAAAALEMVALLETVEFLRRGGRVGKAKAALSSLLRIRPILSLEHGEPVLVGRARTRERAVAEVLERARGPARAAAVWHAEAEDEARRVAERVGTEAGVDPLVAPVGAVTGAHLGPGALGVAILGRDRALD
jgi:DegV family protein with EDD domain